MHEEASPSQDLVLLVDDDPDVRVLVERWLGREGHTVRTFESAEACFTALESAVPDAICLDLSLPGISGIEALERFRAKHPQVPVIILTADREVDTVVGAMQRGAYDYLPKPLERTKLLTTVRNAAERRRLAARVSRLEAQQSGGVPGIVGRSPPMQRFLQQLERVSHSDVTVLIHGESGTGKERAAQAIHSLSARADGPFVALNCAAIPESLGESELFGHEKGAFTGASGLRKGRLELAHRGTLFLDEVAELSPALQAKLLRALQERSFQRVGGNEVVGSDFRLVAATHRDLEAEVKAGRFRQDLYFRLAVFDLLLPPLRDRGDDILLLAEHFLQQFGGGRPPGLSTDARAVLAGYGWPGNVRELQNALQRALVVARDGVIRPDDLPLRVRDGLGATIADVGGGTFPDATMTGQGPGELGGVPPGTLEELERQALVSALERTSGNVAEVVRQLGIGRTTVYRKLKKYRLR